MDLRNEPARINLLFLKSWKQSWYQLFNGTLTYECVDMLIIGQIALRKEA